MKGFFFESISVMLSLVFGKCLVICGEDAADGGVIVEFLSSTVTVILLRFAIEKHKCGGAKKKTKK